MPHPHLLQHHLVGRATPEMPQGHEWVVARPAGHAMVPRLAAPGPNSLPNVLPEPAPLEDFGETFNFSTAIEPYTHGLTGVDQTANWMCINILLTSFLGLLAATFIYRWFQLGNSYLRLLFTMRRREDQRHWMYNHGTFWPAVKKQLLYAPLARQWHNRQIQLSQKHNIDMGTVPGRFVTILLVLYFASNLAYCLLLDWGRESRFSVIAELRGRSGTLATFNLIPTVVFAMRNNPFLRVLRVSYNTFNLMHRWCARMVIFEATIHTIAWAVNSLEAGGVHQISVELSTSSSFAGGMVATVAFGIIFFQAWSPVRHAFYETFINGHRLMVALGLAGVWVHLDYAGLPQFPYVQLIVGIWAMEWGWRIFRICYHNVSRKRGITRVTVEALPAEACKVTFDLSRSWRWRPGCHVYTYLPQFGLWSSHPFSIAWAESKSRVPAVVDTEFGTDTTTPDVTAHDQPSTTIEHSIYRRRLALTSPATVTDAGIAGRGKRANIAQPWDNTVTSISLIVRARNGMTRKLYDKAAASATGTIATWGAIEGPYGGHDSMASYGTVVLFAGGVGITHCVGYIYHLIRQYEAGISSTRKILLLWSVPTTEALEWVRVWMDQILRMEGRRDVLRIQLFITKPRRHDEVISSTGSVQMFPGRCNPLTVLQKEMQDRIGAMGVTVCGPGMFADSVRAAVREVVTEGCVEFIEEAFTY